MGKQIIQDPTFNSNNESTTSVHSSIDYRCTLYPNPVSDILHIDIRDGENLGLSLIVYTLTGQEVLSKPSGNVGKVDLNVSSLLEGFYLLSLIDKYGNINNVKFVKY